MKENTSTKINILPVPTWNHLNVNDVSYQGFANSEEIFEGLENINIEISNPDTRIYDFDEEFEGAVINIKANTDSGVILRFPDSNKDKKDVRVKIHSDIRNGSRLSLSIVKLSDDDRFYAASEAICDEGSMLYMTSISLNNNKTYLEGKIKLEGENSSFDTYTSYILEENEFLDMNYVADHMGKNTEALLVSSGVLKKNSEKNSRQTVNFISGCAGSRGAESEEVLLLDDDLINKSSPLILCTEEDVEGEHGASIGQPDENIIFYLQSRGINLEKIHEMLSIAKIEVALKRIGDTETEKMVHGYLGIQEE